MDDNNTDKNFNVSSVDVLIAIWSKEIFGFIDRVVLRSPLFQCSYIFFAGTGILMLVGMLIYYSVKIQMDEAHRQAVYMSIHQPKKKDSDGE
jgi:hypothetical protein